MTNIIVDDIEISVEKKQIKNIYIKVLHPDGKVHITAPVFVKDDEIKAFAFSHIKWIKNKQQMVINQPVAKEQRYVTGEEHYLWGRRYFLKIVYSDEKISVSIADDKIILQVSENSTSEQRESVLNSWYRIILKDAIPPVFAKCEKLVGVKAKEWRVKNMCTRWGTCNIQAKRVWLNLQLAKKPPECLEYVIIHELVHLLERSHNHVFKGYMNKFCPNWQDIKSRM